METPIISVHHLCYAYESGHPALNDITVSIREGEKVAVVGSNGAGKSTFFLCLNGVLIPEAGEVAFRGGSVTKKRLNDLRRHVGIVFQDADSQIIASSVKAEISFGPMNLKLPREEVVSRVDEAMAYMNLMEFGDRPPHYLSGGEKKRVSIADIIAMKSEVIIFDEPTAALDPANAAMLEDVLERLSNEGKTLLLSTHDMDFAYRWAERVLVFSGGSLIADGSPLDVFLDETTVTGANLRRPTLLDVYKAMVAGGVIPDTGAYPRSIQAFQALFL